MDAYSMENLKECKDTNIHFPYAMTMENLSINQIYAYKDLTELEKDKFAKEFLPTNTHEKWLFKARIYELLGGESGFNELMKLLEKKDKEPHKKE
jgi:hypothetical protein